MSVTCIERLGICSEDRDIKEYWEGIEVYSKYITPYAVYGKWVEYLQTNPKFTPPETPIKLVNSRSNQDFIVKIITYLTWKILNTETPFTVYYNGFVLSHEPLNTGVAIEVYPTGVQLNFLPATMQGIGEILQTSFLRETEFPGIKIKKVTT